MVSTPKCSAKSDVQSGGRGLQGVPLVDGQVAADVCCGHRGFGHDVIRSRRRVDRRCWGVRWVKRRRRASET